MNVVEQDGNVVLTLDFIEAIGLYKMTLGIEDEDSELTSSASECLNCKCSVNDLVVCTSAIAVARIIMARCRLLGLDGTGRAGR
jgi:hypothetical protein